ncbi:MAG TPA: DUF3810 family protein, partial [Phnomibacter sp.]|nr:DUF3810 family protein [Phnomibacter sp.]
MHKWYRQQWVSTTILWLLLWLGAWLPTRWPVGIERYYSRGVYPPVSRVLRGLLGGLPFSLGDVLWGLLFLWLFVKLFNGMKALCKKAVSLKTIKAGARRLITAGLWVWLV